MIDDALSELNDAIGKSFEALKRDLAKLRTGRAHPSLLDSLRVDFYGTPTPIGQMASVNVPEARMLVIKPWDKSVVKAVEKAIRESDLGLNPQTDGDIIRVPMPALTEERRKDLVKLARRVGEDAKVAVRKARHDAKDFIDGLKDEGEVGADDADRGLKKVEEVIQKAVSDVDETVARKEKDILEV
jgi:ribosome recycling factor